MVNSLCRNRDNHHTILVLYNSILWMWRWSWDIECWCTRTNLQFKYIPHGLIDSILEFVTKNGLCRSFSRPRSKWVSGYMWGQICKLWHQVVWLKRPRDQEKHLSKCAEQISEVGFEPKTDVTSFYRADKKLKSLFSVNILSWELCFTEFDKHLIRSITSLLMLFF